MERRPSWGLLEPQVLLCFWLARCACGIGVNWGTQASHPLPPSTVVEMLRDNGIDKVKLFDAEAAPLSALANSGIQVMVGIPNGMLAGLAADEKEARRWVAKNVSDYVDDGVDVRLRFSPFDRLSKFNYARSLRIIYSARDGRYVAVGNEPLLAAHNGSYLSTTLPALQNIQAALSAAGLSDRVKATIPLNADTYRSSTNKPSDGDFRADIHDLMLSIVEFLSLNGSPFTVNIYPFISLYDDPNFPMDYAFFDSSSSSIADGSLTYSNVFDANHDTLVAALRRNGFGNLSIIVGEIGWPTDGDRNANPQLAQRFNQGFVDHVASGSGTPLRPGNVDAYLFSLVDEDQKNIDAGHFETHWGIFAYDGIPKYELRLRASTNNSNGSSLVGAKNVQYLDRRWCVLKPSVSLDDTRIGPSVGYACGRADCTSLGYQTSCADLDVRGNISYAFNSYYQENDQDGRACVFSGLAVVTEEDPSNSTCRFEIMIDVDVGAGTRPRTMSTMNTIGVNVFLYMILPLTMTLG